MKVVILSKDRKEQQWLSKANEGQFYLTWVDEVSELTLHPDAAAYIDFSFEYSEERLEALVGLLPSLVIVNSVIHPLTSLHHEFIRINAWPSFRNQPLIEAAAIDPQKRVEAEKVFSSLGKQLHWVDDMPGFITPRIISMIINEAYLALDEGVSTKEEIDVAMQLGTNYPFGPFEWARQIGRQHIAALLETLSSTDLRYTPSRLLLEEVEDLV